MPKKKHTAVKELEGSSTMRQMRLATHGRRWDELGREILFIEAAKTLLSWHFQRTLGQHPIVADFTPPVGPFNIFRDDLPEDSPPSWFRDLATDLLAILDGAIQSGSGDGVRRLADAIDLYHDTANRPVHRERELLVSLFKPMSKTGAAHYQLSTVAEIRTRLEIALGRPVAVRELRKWIKELDVPTRRGKTGPKREDGIRANIKKAKP